MTVPLQKRRDHNGKTSLSNSFRAIRDGGRGSPKAADKYRKLKRHTDAHGSWMHNSAGT